LVFSKVISERPQASATIASASVSVSVLRTSNANGDTLSTRLCRASKTRALISSSRTGIPPDRMSTTPRTPHSAATNSAVDSDGCHRRIGSTSSAVWREESASRVAPTECSRDNTYSEGSSPSTPGPAIQTTVGMSRPLTADRSRASASGLRRPGSLPTARTSPPTSTRTTPSAETASTWAASWRFRSTTPPDASRRTSVAPNDPRSDRARAGSVDPAGGIGRVSFVTTLERSFTAANPVKSVRERGPGSGSTMRRSQDSVAITGEPPRP